MHGNRVLTNNALLFIAFQPRRKRHGRDRSRPFTLRQVDALREALAQVMEELDLAG